MRETLSGHYFDDLHLGTWCKVKYDAAKRRELFVDIWQTTEFLNLFWPYCALHLVALNYLVLFQLSSVTKVSLLLKVVLICEQTCLFTIYFYIYCCYLVVCICTQKEKQCWCESSQSNLECSQKIKKRQPFFEEEGHNFFCPYN